MYRDMSWLHYCGRAATSRRKAAELRCNCTLTSIRLQGTVCRRELWLQSLTLCRGNVNAGNNTKHRDSYLCNPECRCSWLSQPDLPCLCERSEVGAVKTCCEAEGEGTRLSRNSLLLRRHSGLVPRMDSETNVHATEIRRGRSPV